MKNQIVAGIVTFALALLFLWIISWVSSFATRVPRRSGANATSLIIDHFEDFAKAVIDTTHFVYYLSFIAFGLTLTARLVDSERWRGLMTNRIFGLVFWLGPLSWWWPRWAKSTPDCLRRTKYANYLAWAGIAVHAHLFGEPQRRVIAQLFSRRQAKDGTLAATSTFARARQSATRSTSSASDRTSAGTSRQASNTALSDQSRNVLAKLDAPVQVSVFVEESRFPCRAP